MTEVRTPEPLAARGEAVGYLQRGRRLYERLGFENRSAAWQNGRQIYYVRLL